jgi:uncharacterized membrane protein (UPF0127 family)
MAREPVKAPLLAGRSRRRRKATAAERLAELDAIALPGGLRVHEARSWATRRDGLAGLAQLPDDQGLLIAPCRSVHTIGMRFSLDLVWLDAREDVRASGHDVGPRRLRTDWGARSVIEVACGRGELFAEMWAASRCIVRAEVR